MDKDKFCKWLEETKKEISATMDVNHNIILGATMTIDEILKQIETGRFD